MAAIVSTAATAVRVNAKAAGINTTGSSRAAFLSRKAARSVAAVAATRKVATRAVVTETTAESSADSAELYKEFERLLVDYQFSYKVGDRVTGKVFHCDAKGAWVDIGAKAAALCPGSEASLAQARNAAAVFDIGEEYEFEIIRDDDGDGSLTLSVRKIQVRVAHAIPQSRPTSSKPNDPKT